MIQIEDATLSCTGGADILESEWRDYVGSVCGGRRRCSVRPTDVLSEGAL